MRHFFTVFSRGAGPSQRRVCWTFMRKLFELELLRTSLSWVVLYAIGRKLYFRSLDRRILGMTVVQEFRFRAGTMDGARFLRSINSFVTIPAPKETGCLHATETRVRGFEVRWILKVGGIQIQFSLHVLFRIFVPAELLREPELLTLEKKGCIRRHHHYHHGNHHHDPPKSEAQIHLSYSLNSLYPP